MKFLRRNLSLMLAVRYLNPLRTMFSVITLICLLGVALGVMVLIVVLGVMEGLQDEMENRALAFTPHLVINLNDGMQNVTLSENETHWPELRDRIAAIPGVVCVYPQITAHAFAQSNSVRRSTLVTAIDPGNSAQIAPLAQMLRQGSIDFGEGLNQECVLSSQTAEAMGLSTGDILHLTPVGSLERIAPLLTMVLSPMQTRENPQFMQKLRTIFEGAKRGNGGLVVEKAHLQAILNGITSFNPEKLRPGENDALNILAELAGSHLGHVPFTPKEQQRWLATVNQLAELDGDKEDGKALKGMRDIVLPMDLEVVGIYQAPENMPGPDVYMPLPMAQEMLGYDAGGSNEVMGLCVRVQDMHDTDEIEQAIHALLPDLHAATESHPLGLQWFVVPWTQSYEKWFDMIAKERIMMSFILSTISLIASFCIMAVMFTVILQRRREIAVLQALGATPGKIMAIFTWQGIIIGVTGASLGVILALLVLYYRLEIQSFLAGFGMDPFPMETHGITLPAKYTPSTIALQAVRAFVMVTLVSAIPALYIARQNPAKALRSN